MATKQADQITVACECGRDYKPQFRRAHENSYQHQAWMQAHATPGGGAETPATAGQPPTVVNNAAPVVVNHAAPGGIMCQECGGGPFFSFEEIDKHRSGNAHVALRAGQAKVLREQQEEAQRHLAVDLPDDLLQPVVRIDWSPQERAKRVRQAFSVRGWPNLEHPGTVRNFLEEHHVPIAVDESRKNIGNPNKFALV